MFIDSISNFYFALARDVSAFPSILWSALKVSQYQWSVWNLRVGKITYGALTGLKPLLMMHKCGWFQFCVIKQWASTRSSGREATKSKLRNASFEVGFVQRHFCYADEAEIYIWYTKRTVRQQISVKTVFFAIERGAHGRCAVMQRKNVCTDFKRFHLYDCAGVVMQTNQKILRDFHTVGASAFKIWFKSLILSCSLEITFITLLIRRCDNQILHIYCHVTNRGLHRTWK